MTVDTEPATHGDQLNILITEGTKTKNLGVAEPSRVRRVDQTSAETLREEPAELQDAGLQPVSHHRCQGNGGASSGLRYSPGTT